MTEMHGKGLELDGGVTTYRKVTAGEDIEVIDGDGIIVYYKTQGGLYHKTTFSELEETHPGLCDDVVVDMDEVYEYAESNYRETTEGEELELVDGDGIVVIYKVVSQGLSGSWYKTTVAQLDKTHPGLYEQMVITGEELCEDA